MSEFMYDIAVLGAGPGGYVAAIRAAQLDKKVVVIEREHLGGVCLNWGCIPTKSLLRNADVIELLGRGKEYGFSAENVKVDYGAAVDRSRKIAARLVKGVEALLRENRVDVVWGAGKLTDAHTIEVQGKDGEVRAISADNIILATGSRARVIPGVEVDGNRVLTAREALARRTLPASAIIIGAGPIGLEFATIWNAYGATVTVVEMLDHILPAEDAEAAAELERALRRQKVKTLTLTHVESVQPTEKGVAVRVTGPNGEQTLEAEVALIAIGVRPNSEGLGLEEIGVELNKGWVVVDHYMRTSLPHIFAIGDLNGKLPLAHVASAQGVMAAEMIAEFVPAFFEEGSMPRGTYTNPQVASFGMSEERAQELGRKVRVGKFPFLPNGKALALGENQGFVKIVAEENSGEIIGAVIVGPEATELLAELVLAHAAELTPYDLAHTVHAHPTLSEAIMEAAHGVFGKPIHTV